LLPNSKLQLAIAFLAALGRRLQLNFSRSADRATGELNASDALLWKAHRGRKWAHALEAVRPGLILALIGHEAALSAEEVIVRSCQTDNERSVAPRSEYEDRSRRG
jgi:hypothetical protein